MTFWRDLAPPRGMQSARDSELPRARPRLDDYTLCPHRRPQQRSMHSKIMSAALYDGRKQLKREYFSLFFREKED